MPLLRSGIWTIIVCGFAAVWSETPFTAFLPQLITHPSSLITLYLSSVVGISSISSKAWFSPPMAQMKV